jgi:mono/diheme cytochrome c family protein
MTMSCSGMITGGLLLSALLLFSPRSFASGDGGQLYQAKCARCHGKNGKGKPALKAPSLVSDEVRNLSDEAIRDLINSRANGELEKKAAHSSMKQRLTADQVGQIVTHIREMQTQRH